MKRITTPLIFGCFALLFAASACLAQMYTVADLGTLSPTGINLGGQVVGNLDGHAHIWTQTSGFQDLGMLPGGTFSSAAAINDLGQVTGVADAPAIYCEGFLLPQITGFVWSTANGMHSLGTFTHSRYPACVFKNYGADINILGEVVGVNGQPTTTYIDPILWTEETGITLLPGDYYQGEAHAINNLSQVVGAVGTFSGPLPFLETSGVAALWDKGVFRKLGTLAEAGVPACSEAEGINELGQVVGWSTTSGCYPGTLIHAFLWTQGAGMKDLGTLPGATTSAAYKINFFGQVIGSSDGLPFIWTEPAGMRDLNTLIAGNSGWVLYSATGINIWGEIVGSGALNGQAHGFLLNPVYKAFVQPPINADGTSVLTAERGVLPVKFTLTQNDVPTCTLPPATIAVTRTAGGTVGSIDESIYSMAADSGSNFRIDGCQYMYHVAASSLGVGTYRVDIRIQGMAVGHAVFALN